MSKNGFYDHFANDSHTRLGGAFARAFFRRIFKFADIKKDKSVLEIGPGRGLFADVCIENGIEYAAVEPNKQLADAIRKKGVDVISKTVPPMPDFDRTFDAIVMINCFEHMNGLAEALELTNAVSNLLNTGGKFIICSPDYLNMKHNFFNCDFSHGYITTRRRLDQLLISAGFERTQSRFLCGPIAGIPAILLAAIAARMPFAFFNAVFPNSKIFTKLYKAQLSLSRKILIIGHKPD